MRVMTGARARTDAGPGRPGLRVLVGVVLAVSSLGLGLAGAEVAAARATQKVTAEPAARPTPQAVNAAMRGLLSNQLSYTVRQQTVTTGAVTITTRTAEAHLDGNGSAPVAGVATAKMLTFAPATGSRVVSGRITVLSARDGRVFVNQPGWPARYRGQWVVFHLDTNTDPFDVGVPLQSWIDDGDASSIGLPFNLTALEARPPPAVVGS